MRSVRVLTDALTPLGETVDPSRQREEMPDDLANLVPAAVYTALTGACGRWLYASPQIEDILGHSAQEFLDDPGLWVRLLHVEDREWVLTKEERESHVVDLSRSCSEYRMVARNGRVVWVLDDVTLRVDPVLGSIQHGLLFDITHRKVAELLQAGQADVLGRIARGAPLEETLLALAESLVRVTGAVTCAVTVAATGATYVGGVQQRFELHRFERLPYVHADGSVLGEILLLGARIAPDDQPDDHGGPLGWARSLAALAVDRSCRGESEARSYSLLEATLQSTAEGILVVDRAGRVVSANQKFREMWSIPAALVEAGDDHALQRFVLDQVCDPEAFLTSARRAHSLPTRPNRDEVAFLDGRIFERDSHPQILDGCPVGLVWSFRDVTMFRKLERELRHQAHTDSLTSLPNRHRFMQRLSEASVDGHVAAGYALLLVDLDDFKTINDGLGHLAGDAVLVALAGRVADQVRDSDIAARLGGDEFALLTRCPGGIENAQVVAEWVVAQLGEPVEVDGRQLSIRASIGIALSDGATSARDLLRNADLAMYTAKRHGGGSSRAYEPAMHEAAIARLDLKSDLARAIDDDALAVAYQPVVSLESGLIVGFEALARWEHPQLGTISPGEFVPLAEETGLIGRLGHWVLSRACADLAAWQETLGTRVPQVSVNLSPRELDDPNLADQVAGLIAASGLPPDNICLEVTESALGDSDDDVSAALADLRARGIRLALDDFGTGHSSLARLGSYPFDVIKIDRSFVMGLGEGTRDQAVVLAVLRLAEAFGLDVVAEGVETATQRDILAAMGCERGQGFLYSRAVPPDEALALLISETLLG